MSTEIFELQLPDRGLALAASADRTLLQSMLAAGVAWRSSCRNGTCRSCLGRLEAGAVRYEIPWPGLNPDEKAEGMVLPCVAYPLGDLRLRFVGL